MTNWIDISQPFTNDIAHWPGVQPFQFKLSATMRQTGSVNIGEIAGCVHTGTHVDAPFHFNNDAKTIEQMDINRYIGEAIVLDVTGTDQINAAYVKPLLEAKSVSRILLKTSLPNNPKRFPNSIPFLDPDLIPLLAAKGVKLLGVDMPSVDPLDSKELAVHHALHEHDIYILENIMLDNVAPGHYELIALPLAIPGADGSPVRAVIKPIE
ncbi:arylformamidase [Ornithinibacillus gellani]|uniref:arylformamidase n=1 Tax=Ornithinibacillus gellani TaxID=2293253 RepID=UPI000F466386|nr:arylformamidase [Ornithinibacillus gellani]TQS70599.1 arylformamidase [Ornithinibacillus gellani]